MKRKDKRLQSRLEYILFIIILKFFRLFPARVGESFFKGLALFAGCVLGIRRKVAEANIAMVYPEFTKSQRRELIRKMYLNMAEMTAEEYLYDDGYFNDRMTMVGEENLRKVLEHGKGAVMVSMHIGNWELAGRYMSRIGIPTGAVMKPQRNPWFNEFTENLRRSAGVTLIHTHKSFKHIIRALRANTVIAFIADQDARQHGVRMDFLGVPASVHTGPAKTAIKTGSPIFLGVCVRNPDKTFTLYYEEPVFTEDIEDTRENVIDLTQQMVERMESYIRKYPEQWFWLHRRWKNAHRAQPVVRSSD